jgi:hypothetical protein
MQSLSDKQPEPAIDLDEEQLRKRHRFHPLDVLGVIAGLVPFAVPYRTTTTEFSEKIGENLSIGTRTTVHMDYAALAGGAIALVCAIGGLTVIGRFSSRPLRLAIFIALLSLAALQIILGVLAASGPGGGVRGVTF